MAAVLACGPSVALSHGTAAALWGIAPARPGPIAVSVLDGRHPRRHREIRVHRRSALGDNDVTVCDRIPVTTAVATLVDLATTMTRRELEAAINAADKHDLTDPDHLRATLDAVVPRPGMAKLRRVLDDATFALTDSDLERRFLPLVRQAGLPRPQTGAHLNGFKVDFHWPALGLVVETDGLRYHRTPAQQAKDRVRDQSLTVAGLTVLRFTHAQIAFDPRQVKSILAAMAR
jgi:very-short-patch-repair endonuclease